MLFDPTFTLPTSPTTFTLDNTVKQVKVKWDRSTMASDTRIGVLRSTTNTLGSAVLMGEVIGADFFIDNMVSPNTTYYYWIQAATPAYIFAVPVGSVSVTTIGVTPSILDNSISVFNGGGNGHLHRFTNVDGSNGSYSYSNARSYTGSLGGKAASVSGTNGVETATNFATWYDAYYFSSISFSQIVNLSVELNTILNWDTPGVLGDVSGTVRIALLQGSTVVNSYELPVFKSSTGTMVYGQRVVGYKVNSAGSSSDTSGFRLAANTTYSLRVQFRKDRTNASDAWTFQCKSVNLDWWVSLA